MNLGQMGGRDTPSYLNVQYQPGPYQPAGGDGTTAAGRGSMGVYDGPEGTEGGGVVGNSARNTGASSVISAMTSGAEDNTLEGSLRDTGGSLRDLSGSMRDTGGSLRDLGGSLRDTGGSLASLRDTGGSGGSLRDTGGSQGSLSNMQQQFDQMRMTAVQSQQQQGRGDGGLDSIIGMQANGRRTAPMVVGRSDMPDITSYYKGLDLPLTSAAPGGDNAGLRTHSGDGGKPGGRATPPGLPFDLKARSGSGGSASGDHLREKSFLDGMQFSDLRGPKMDRDNIKHRFHNDFGLSGMPLRATAPASFYHSINNPGAAPPGTDVPSVSPHSSPRSSIRRLGDSTSSVLASAAASLGDASPGGGDKAKGTGYQQF